MTNPEVEEHGGKSDDETLHPRGPEDLAEWSHDGGTVVTLVQGLVEGDGNQRSGPHSVSRVDEESSNDTCHTVTDKVGTESDQDLVCETCGIGLVIYTVVSA